MALPLHYTDFDRRFLDALQRQSPPTQPAKMTDAEVITAMAEIWVDSGGEGEGLDEYYIVKLRAEIDRIRKWRKI